MLSSDSEAQPNQALQRTAPTRRRVRGEVAPGPPLSWSLSEKGGILLRLIHDRNVGILADESMLDNYSVFGK